MNGIAQTSGDLASLFGFQFAPKGLPVGSAGDDLTPVLAPETDLTEDVSSHTRQSPQHPATGDMVSLSDLAKNLLETLGNALADVAGVGAKGAAPPAYSDSLPKLDGTEGFGYSKIKLSLNYSSMSVSSRSDESGADMSSSFVKIKLSLTMTSQTYIKNGEAYNVTQFSLSFQGKAVSQSIHAGEDGTSHSKSLESLRLKYDSSSYSSVSFAANDEVAPIGLSLMQPPTEIVAKEQPVAPKVETKATEEGGAKPAQLLNLTDSFNIRLRGHRLEHGFGHGKAQHSLGHEHGRFNFTGASDRKAGLLFSPTGETPLHSANESSVSLLSAKIKINTSSQTTQSDGITLESSRSKLKLVASAYVAQQTNTQSLSENLAKQLLT